MANTYTYIPPAPAFETIISRVTDPSSIPKVSDKASSSKKRRLTTQKNFPLAFQAQLTYQMPVGARRAALGVL